METNRLMSFGIRGLLCICSVLVLGEGTVKAQHEQQYSQFMYNKLAFNPAFAGTLGDLTFTALYRNQWMGFEGAPTTMGLSADMALNRQRVGLGMNLFRHTIGIYDTWTMDGAYAYKIQTGPRSRLSAGLQASLRYYGVNYLDPRLRGAQELSIDNAITLEQLGRYTPNFGFGLYFSTDRFFVGLSVPRLLNINIDFTDRDVPLSRETRHAFVMAGGTVPLYPELEWTPQLLVKFVKNAPLSYDINSIFTLAQRYMLGLSYRSGGLERSLGESIDILVGFQISNRLFMGFSYDILLSDIRRYSSGSVEAVLRYQLTKEEETRERVINPRYF